ncbi:MAG: efflux RND transporter periplasmic adaptor subunit [Rhizomicrobium sp.]
MTLLNSAARPGLAHFVAEQSDRARAAGLRVEAMIKKLNWKQIALLAAAGVVVLGAAVYWFVLRPAPTSYATAAVTRGDVVTTIGASGSVNPVVTVQVGTYVSGTIETLSCDFNTRVKSGQLCATIDPKPYQIVVDQDQAELNTARAQLNKDQANVAYTQVNQKRYDALLAANAISHDADDASRDANKQAIALAHLDSAQIAEKAAVLKAAQINLAYTKIVSPVSGTVVSRNVTAGQTVAASFQTPTLFLIATDLTKMQVDTNVSESDIAGATKGADASFTVDAFANKTFHGRVAQVRQAPISVQNVITYDVVITVSNPDLLLKPGMTATAKIVKAQARNVLRVPSQALRFTPTGAAKNRFVKTAKSGQRFVWVKRDGKLVAIPVTVGLDDDSFAEIKSGDLKPGDQVVLSVAASGTSGKSKAAPTSSLHL